MVDEKRIIKHLFEKQKPLLKHTEQPHKKIILAFSGIPCTGKTHIAKLIEEKYKGVRINSDDLRKIIRKLGKKKKILLDEVYKEEILKKYLYGLIENYPFKNKLVILDSGIDRKYEEVNSRAKKHGFELLVIRVEGNKSIAEKGIVKKLGKPDKNFVNNIDRWVKEYEEFGKTKKYDFLVKNDQETGLETEDLFNKLDKLL